jgi:AsmA protein
MGKKILITLLIVMTTIIVVLGVLIATFDLNKYKPQIEKKVYEATGKELKINGDIGVSLSPFGLSVKDIVIKNPKGFSKNDMLKLKKVAISLQIMPLLSKQVKVNYVKLEDMNILVEKSKKGLMNLTVGKKEAKKAEPKSSTKEEQGKLPMVNVNKILLSNINIIYDDKQTKAKAKVTGLNITINDIALNGDKDILKALSLKGLMKISNIKYDKYNIDNISADFSFKDKVATVSPLKLTMFNSIVDGKLIYNMNGKKPKIYLEDHIAKLDLKNVSKLFIKNKKISLDGYVKTDIKLSMTGQTPKDIKRSLTGTIYVVGDNFGINGVDLNKVFKSLDDAKSINKKDIAGFLVAGPLGLALSKGMSGGNMMAGLKGGTTAVKKLIINAPVKNGIITLKDVAMKVGQTRVALKGKIDIFRERFIKVQAGVVGSNGCAKIAEDISGTFSKPKYSTKALTSGVVANTVTSLLGQFTKSASTPKKSNCKVFYNGSVK